MFIRLKRRDNSVEYAYLVSNSWLKRRKMPRQRVGRYLGRVFRYPSSGSVYSISGLGFKETLLSMIDFTLIDCGFVRGRGRVYRNSDCLVDLTNFKVKTLKGRDCVILVNDGYICSWSLRQLFGVDVNGREDAPYFARVLRLSGILVNPGLFVRLFGVALRG